MDSLVNWVFQNNALIIEVLLGLILLLALYLGYRGFKASAIEEIQGTQAHLPKNLEEALQKILEKATALQSTAPATGAEGGATEDQERLLLEIGNLKSELETKQKEIEDLRAGAGAVAQPQSNDSSELEAKISELQSKLAEYEIISEDIADLSFYKEQNAKLEKELSELKGKSATTAPTATAQTAEEPAAAEPTQPEKKSEEKPQALSEASPTPEEVSAAVDASVDAVVENLAVTESEPAEESAPLGDMDMDKMLQEAAEIKVDESVNITPEEAIGDSLDEKKLLQEATALGTVTDEDAELMGEFENFVKKNEG